MSKKQNTVDLDKMLWLNGTYLSFFPSIALKLTGSCRMDCPFCCEPNRQQVIYKVDNFIKITDILIRLGTKRLCLTGGEPLLYQDLLNLVKYTNSLGFFNLLLTGDGELLGKRYKEFVPYLNAVRFSIHGIGSMHDQIVQQIGAFEEMEKTIKSLTEERLACYVTTVVTSMNFESLPELAEFCVKNNIKTYFLFGMMRSGRGNEYLKKNREVTKEEIAKMIVYLENKYQQNTLELIYYDYKNKAECILIYGNGRVVIDPYPFKPNFQLEIGNILTETSDIIIERFNKDPENSHGHSEHLSRYYGMNNLIG